MAADNEKLFMVSKADEYKILKVWVFRTRAAARTFARNQQQRCRSVCTKYTVRPATWGPEQ